MAEFLIKAEDSPIADSADKWYQAAIIFVAEDGHTWGTKEGPPYSFILKVPGISRADAVEYISEWRHNVTYTVVNSQPSQDGYRIKLQSDAISLSGKGAIVRAQVEEFFTKWKCAIQSTTANSVTFDVRIYNALTSEGFWDRDVTKLSFLETEYNQSTGSHLIEDVSGATDAQIQDVCQTKGVAYVSPRSFIATRQEARQKFQDEIAERFRQIGIDRRRWYVSDAGMTALRNAGGILTVTPQQFVANIIDRITV